MKKAYLYYSNVSKLKIAEAKKSLPDFRLQKLENLQKIEDKRLSAGVWILLCKVLKKHHIKLSKYPFKLTSTGKPYLENCRVHISYSHSGDYCLVAISKEPVGVDVEKDRKCDEKISSLIFNENDIEQLKNKSFLDVWTLKESFGKLTGKGLTKEIQVDYLNSSNIYTIKGYTIGVTSNKYKIKEINL